MARLARPGPVHVVDERQRGLGPLPVGDVAEGLLEAQLVAALAELCGVRDEVARDRMEGLRDRRSGCAVLTQDDERERGVGQRERHQDADDRTPARHPLSPEHPSHYSGHPPKGDYPFEGFTDRCYRDDVSSRTARKT